ncbi:hypothetical protein DICPUDRAFT_77555 [Dictyostelium purpureum]|uniref:Uncharacterized protein n=1 Tax=Dictyostelium purpureum TaxID=5786 RepID=F0ZGY8_DICPU|nr:uncharacterized protein DICPUDRAFT_77555 [Dictyostelium purpureum]EGC36797.1 hypothetical protein DICPUDRAFT_77555 [Dictyostelium purpureum]|eukprot:XP_003286668.1 hypothetical protein DICPUDRAFT_77555 [Dictyostelium purpureum]
MYRLRLQIFPIIKRFYTYYYHLLSQQNIFRSNKTNNQECFIDEFGWKVLIKGVTIDIISSAFVQILLYYIYNPLLLWKSKPYEYYLIDIDNNHQFNNDNNNNITYNNNEVLALLKNKQNNLYSMFSIISISIFVGGLLGVIQYISQYFKIKLQFRLEEKLQKVHKDSKKFNINPIFCLNQSSSLFNTDSNKNKSYRKIQDEIDSIGSESGQSIKLNHYYKINESLNLTERTIKEGMNSPVLNFLYSVFGDSLLSVFNEVFFYFVFLFLFNILNYYQASIFINIIKGGQSNTNALASSNPISYFINYLYYRSPVLILLISSIVAIIVTHPLVVFQTQLEAFQFSNLLLNLIFKYPEPLKIKQNSNDQEVPNRKDEDLISFSKKFKRIYSKNHWVGFVGRLLYVPLKFTIVSLWFDFLVSL